MAGHSALTRLASALVELTFQGSCHHQSSLDKFFNYFNLPSFGAPSDSDCSPNAIFLEDTLQKQFPELASDTLQVIRVRLLIHMRCNMALSARLPLFVSGAGA